MADEVPIAGQDPDANWDPSLDTSAIYALRRLDPKSATESAGVIYQNADGKYAGSIPVSQNLRDAFALRAQIPKGFKMAGIYHTHPSDDQDSQYFSPKDVQIAEQLKIPSYVLFQHDGSIRSYTPGKTATRRVSMPGELRSLKVAGGGKLNVSDDIIRKIQVAKAYNDQQKALQDTKP